jgi:hypothetical protein
MAKKGKRLKKTEENLLDIFKKLICVDHNNRTLFFVKTSKYCTLV